MLLPCTQERRQTVVAAHQPPGRVPESALSLGLWRLLRRSRAPASSAPRLEGPPAGAAASAGVDPVSNTHRGAQKTLARTCRKRRRSRVILHSLQVRHVLAPLGKRRRRLFGCGWCPLPYGQV